MLSAAELAVLSALESAALLALESAAEAGVEAGVEAVLFVAFDAFDAVESLLLLSPQPVSARAHVQMSAAKSVFVVFFIVDYFLLSRYC